MGADDNNRGAVLPVYFVADESGSMSGVMSDLNSGLVSLLDRFHQDSMLAPKIRFGVVGFADDAVCHLEVANLLNVQRMPVLASRGGTSFIAAFTDLRHRIEADVSRLKKEGLGVHRPAVFFLTDGQATDANPWEPSHQILCDPSFGPHPNILAFGFGQADPGALLRIATKKEWAYIAAATTSPATAITEFAKQLTQSLVASAQAIAQGQSQIVVEPPAGFASVMDIGLV